MPGQAAQVQPLPHPAKKGGGGKVVLIVLLVVFVVLGGIGGAAYYFLVKAGEALQQGVANVLGDAGTSLEELLQPKDGGVAVQGGKAGAAFGALDARTDGGGAGVKPSSEEPRTGAVGAAGRPGQGRADDGPPKTDGRPKGDRAVPPPRGEVPGMARPQKEAPAPPSARQAGGKTPSGIIGTLREEKAPEAPPAKAPPEEPRPIPPAKTKLLKDLR